MKVRNSVIILVAEDEEDIRNMIAEQLNMEKHQVITVGDGYAALQIFQKEKIDLAILDIMMPLMDGLTLLRKIREKSDMPVILVTARGEEMDRVAGLSMGADDYLVKPFSLAELSARVGVQLRHLYRNAEQMNTQDEWYECGELRLNVNSTVAFLGEKQLSLNAKEFLLLKYFMENKERVLTKKQIYQAVWNDEYVYDDNTIMVHISRLRNKIEKDSKQPKYLLTMKGIGYKFTGAYYEK